MDIGIKFTFAFFFFFKLTSEFIEVWKTYVLIVHIYHDSIFKTKRERERERRNMSFVSFFSSVKTKDTGARSIEYDSKKNLNKRETDQKITKEVTYNPYLYHLCTNLSLLVSRFGTEHMYTSFVFIHTNACFGHKSQAHNSHNVQYNREIHPSKHNIQTQAASTCPNPRQGQNTIRLAHTPTHE